MYQQTELFHVEVPLESRVQVAVESLPETDVPLYQVALVINKILEDLSNEYRVRPQMIYNYGKNKMVVQGTQVTRVTKNQAVTFITKFIGKKIK